MSVIIITGASSGIGRALALRAARAGYDVVAVGRNAAALEAVAERVRREGGQIVTAIADVSESSSAPAIVALARTAFGRIDVLVNNAGHAAVGPLSAQSDEALRMQFGTHVIGPVALVREALPLLRASRGTVFMVGSGVARVPVGGLGAYAPSKAALRSATTILRRELKPDGIAVTYVDPGAVDTAFMTRAGFAGAPPAVLAAPEDVARKILLAIAKRPRVLNAVPWQTAFVALGELFPRITDIVLERHPALVGTASPQQPALDVERFASADEGEAALRTPGESGAAAGPAAFDDVLAPVRRRMERVKLREDFVRDLLDDGALLDPSEVALRWAGMPNKNERAVTLEVFEALEHGGFVVRDGGGYRVVRTPG